MYKQLSLFETSQPRPPKFSLFLAIFPDHHTAEQIIDFGNRLRRIHGMRGRLRPVSHLHVSLLFLGHTFDVPETVVGTVGHVCKAVTAVTGPFEIKFDRVLSFRGQPGNHPLVLVNNNHESDALRSLHGLLHAKFSKYVSPTSPTSKFVPHLTLLYDKQEITPKPIEPVSWMVKEIILVRSEVGATKYRLLGRWGLGK
jgi:RNA 2',3'-cyclic 3'-phosphodiesterase